MSFSSSVLFPLSFLCTFLFGLSICSDSSCCGPLFLEFLVEAISCVSARHVVPVPVESAEGGAESERNAEVSDQAPSEHTSDRFDGHFEFELKEDD
ncbi:hypothetical protein K449DRAFT_380880 [Hypoxylon sp. EC38]|nr:hypothetical protein K449DRAFT_380880 [Hypoxylon sp. EC38]